MKFKKILIILCLILSLPAKAANLEYMNFDWWKNYNDEILIRHLQTLYNNNHDLKIAAYKTKQAEENIKLAGANQLPQVGFEGDFTRVMRGAQTQFGNVIIPKYSQNQFVLPLNAAYEIDIWGENYFTKKSAKKQKEIAAQEERAVYIYITSMFAANYYNLIKADELEKTLREIIGLQTEIVKMTEKKFNSGLAPVNELLNEKQHLVRFEEDLNKLIENRKVLNNELVTLLALKTDKEIEHAMFDEISAPKAPESLTATVIQYRPDLISSENYAQKTGIDVRVARREFLPKFILYGNLGFNAYDWSKIFSNTTFLSNIGVAPRWDIFTGGAKLARYRINKYEYKKAAENYEKTVLVSMQEVNDALALTKRAKANLLKSDEGFSIEKEKHVLAQKQFTIGDSSRLDEMKSNVNLLIAREQNISAFVDNIVATISLYNAVGGIDYTRIDNL